MSKREHDNLYLYDKQYFKKPKFAWEVLKDHLKKNKKKKNSWGYRMCKWLSYIFKKHFLHWSFIGSDINRNLISESKKQLRKNYI